MIGTKLGPFEVLGKLGEGGMGEVYRARDTKLGARRRAESPPCRCGRRRGAPGALPSRGPPARGPESRAHRPGPRLRGLDRRSCAGDGARRGRDTRRTAGVGTASARRCASDRSADRRGPRSGTREGHHPSRPQAGERQGCRRRHGQGPGFRPRQSAGFVVFIREQRIEFADADRPRHRDRHDSRHRGLHGARAGTRTRDRQARRHLGVRGRAVRDALRPAAVRRRGDLRRDGVGASAGDRLEPASWWNTRVDPASAPALPRTGSETAAARHRRSADRAGHASRRISRPGGPCRQRGRQHCRGGARTFHDTGLGDCDWRNADRHRPRCRARLAKADRTVGQGAAPRDRTTARSGVPGRIQHRCGDHLAGRLDCRVPYTDIERPPAQHSIARHRRDACPARHHGSALSVLVARQPVDRLLRQRQAVHDCRRRRKPRPSPRSTRGEAARGRTPATFCSLR